MLPRQSSENIREKAKIHLKNNGWTYRNACKPNGPLGVTFEHLCRVLTGVRESRRLLKAVFALPQREKFLQQNQEISQ